MEEPVALTRLKISLENDELDKFFIGGDGYYFPNKWMDVPTDIDTIFLRGLNAFIRENPSKKQFLKNHITHAITKLVDKPIECWWALSILYSYYFAYKEGALHFDIDVKNIINNLNLNLNQHKEYLSGNKNFIGNRFEGGLWENVENMVLNLNRVLNQDNIQILS